MERQEKQIVSATGILSSNTEITCFPGSTRSDNEPSAAAAKGPVYESNEPAAKESGIICISERMDQFQDGEKIVRSVSQNEGTSDGNK